MFRTITACACALLMLVSAAGAARYPVLGGPGLVRLQSAKAGQRFGYRTINLLTSYSDVGYLQGGSLPGSSYLDGWTHQLGSYSPHPDLAVLVALAGHGNKWSLGTQPAVPVDLTLGNVGDAVLAFKYHRALLGGALDLGALPMLSIPFGKQGEQADGTPIVTDYASNTGRLDFGGKLLADYNLDRMTVLANVGLLTRGEQRAQVPLGAGLEYSITPALTGFGELSGELRIGTAPAELPDSLVPRGMGYDATEFRVGAGARFTPLPLVQVMAAIEVGLTHATAPWHVILGLDLPALAGRVRGGRVLGSIAGLIKDRDNGVPMKGMITFPGAEIPGTVSDDVGKYVAELPAGNYVIHIYANGYRWLQRKISVEQGKRMKWDLTLKRKLGTVSGKAFDARTMAPLAATVKFAGTALPEIKADSLTGAFTAVLPPAKYLMTVSAPGYKPREFPFPLRDKQELDQPAALDPDVVERPQPPAGPAPSSAARPAPSPVLTPSAPAPATAADKVLTPKMPEFKPSIPELAPGP
ncbi:MAG: hypothetical protein MUF78_11475 [Candidatus Edwardsbacteria bacterium]|nr:hypothetical protein [Candidatus Edwardsbacteria bacterium]